MLGNGSVLIIDDETAITSSLEAILTDEGYKVYKANSGEKGIELALSESPDVILADVWMPGIDGIQTLQVVKESELHSEVILMSGHANIETAVKATKIGAFDFIEKPLSMETVIKVIAEAIESKEYKWSEKEGSSKGKNTFLKIPKLSNEKKQQKNKATQKTISRSIVLYGRGLHSGLKTGLILDPLPPDSGIHFGNLTNPETIPADVLFVDNTNHSTNLKHGSVIARTIEHLMSALYAYGITNLLIKIGAEVPIMDGSSIVFCQEIEKALVIEQNKSINHIVIDKTYEVGGKKSQNGYIRIEPSKNFEITYKLDYPRPIGIQNFTYKHKNTDSYKLEIAPARTFNFVSALDSIEQMGLGEGGRWGNVILVDDEKVVNTELRFLDEFVRHKILDLLGDFSLVGAPIIGNVFAEKSGHSLNIKMTKIIKKEFFG